MELTSPKTIKELLLKYKTKASKGLGQNFLTDKNVLSKIIEAADIKPDDIILEVGPGIGTLTQELAQRAGKVIAVEKDKTMVEILGETLKNFNNIEIIHGDILKIESLENYLKIKNYKIKNYKVVANIPYYITAPLIRYLLENENPPQKIILMLQKEVAKRICSNPPDMSLLAVSVQFYAEPKIISYISKNCFWPSPKVDSAIIKITPREQFPHIVRELFPTSLFFKIVKAGFSQPRKQLVNNLTTLKLSNGVKLTKEQISGWLLENNLKPNQRAETLAISDWINLTKSFEIFNT